MSKIKNTKIIKYASTGLEGDSYCFYDKNGEIVDSIDVTILVDEYITQMAKSGFCKYVQDSDFKVIDEETGNIVA